MRGEGRAVRRLRSESDFAILYASESAQATLQSLAPRPSSLAPLYPDAKRRTSQRRRLADRKLAAVGADEILNDGKADAVALHAFVAAHTTLEQVLDLVLGDAFAIVLDDDLEAVAARAGRRERSRRKDHAPPRPLEA